MGRQGKRKEVFEDVKKKQMEVWQEIQDLMEKRSELQGRGPQMDSERENRRSYLSFNFPLLASGCGSLVFIFHSHSLDLFFLSFSYL